MGLDERDARARERAAARHRGGFRRPCVAAPERCDLAEMATFGSEQQLEAGHLLFAAGEDNLDLFLVLEGTVELFRRRTAARWSSRRSPPARSSASSRC